MTARLRSRIPQERAAAERTSAGFSLIEVIIAMFVLALMSMAVIPLLITAAKASIQNSTLTAATSFANAELASLRGQFPNDADSSCAAVEAEIAARTAAGITGPPGSGLTGAFTPDPDCDDVSAFPGVLRVTIEVSGNGSSLVTLSTEILVAAA